MPAVLERDLLMLRWYFRPSDDGIEVRSRDSYFLLPPAALVVITVGANLELLILDASRTCLRFLPSTYLRAPPDALIDELRSIDFMRSLAYGDRLP